MPLQDQTLSISFNKGLNTKTDSKQILPGELLTLQNGVFTSVQEILKRNGYTPLSTSINTGGTVSAGNFAGVLNNSIAIGDGYSLYSFAEADQKWARKGVKTSLSLSSVPVGINAGKIGGPGTTPQSSLHSSGSEIVVWTSTKLTTGAPIQNIEYSFLDTASGVPISSGSATVSGLPWTASDNRPFVFGSNFLVLTQTNTNTIYYQTVPVDGSVGLVQPTLSLLTGSTKTTIAAAQTTSNFYIIYTNGSGNPTLAKYNSSAALVGSPVTLVADTYTVADLSIDALAGRIYIAVSGTVGLYTYIYDLNLNLIATGATQSNPGTVRQITGTLTADGLYYVVYVGAFASDFNVYKLILTRSNNAIQTGVFLASAIIEGQAFSDALGNAYVIVLNRSVVQPTSFILRDLQTGPNPVVSPIYGAIDVPSVAGKFAEGTSSDQSQLISFQPISNVIVSSPTTILFPYNNADQTSIVNGSITEGYGISQLKITVGTKTRDINLANNLNITGGTLSIYDGAGVAESGFHLFPEYISSTVGNAGSIPPGTYSYVCIYQWTDNFGNITRSAPSVPKSIVVPAGSSSVTIDYTALDLTEMYKKPNVQAMLYRTTDGGTVYFRTASTPLYNTPGTPFSFSDHLPNTQIIGNEQLYTTGGEVDNIGPPATDSITSFKNRLILVQADNPYVWWFSKQVIPGFPAEFSDLFTQTIDSKGGPMTAVSTMDDKLIFFKEYNIFYVIGDGPAPSGANNDFSYPQIITTDVGCISPDSIVLIPSGIMFQSHKGIYLLDRGLNCSYIGAPVESFNAETITSAKVIPNTTQVRFTLASGTILVFDYYVNQWSQFTNLLAADSVIYKNTYTLLSPSGVVTEETPGVYTDSGVSIPLTIKTGWFSFGNLQGFQRIKEFLLLGESESNTALTISLSHNFLPTINQTDVIPITANARLQYRIFPQRQKCESMQITISDAPSAPLGEGLRLSALGFNIGIKKGLNKVPASNNYG